MNFSGMLKEGTLKDKVILVTGGGTGLGKSMGKYFMELGGNLIITSRRQEVLDETAAEFNNYKCLLKQYQLLHQRLLELGAQWDL